MGRFCASPSYLLTAIEFTLYRHIGFYTYMVDDKFTCAVRGAYQIRRIPKFMFFSSSF